MRRRAFISLLGGANIAGQIVGVYTDSNDITHGFLLSGGIYTTIDDPLGTPPNANAKGINDAGLQPTASGLSANDAVECHPRAYGRGRHYLR
jgi:hypothetical protein